MPGEIVRISRVTPTSAEQALELNSREERYNLGQFFTPPHPIAPAA